MVAGSAGGRPNMPGGPGDTAGDRPRVTVKTTKRERAAGAGESIAPGQAARSVLEQPSPVKPGADYLLPAFFEGEFHSSNLRLGKGIGML